MTEVMEIANMTASNGLEKVCNALTKEYQAMIDTLDIQSTSRRDFGRIILPTLLTATWPISALLAVCFDYFVAPHVMKPKPGATISASAIAGCAPLLFIQETIPELMNPSYKGYTIKNKEILTNESNGYRPAVLIDNPDVFQYSSPIRFMFNDGWVLQRPKSKQSFPSMKYDEAKFYVKVERESVDRIIKLRDQL